MIAPAPVQGGHETILVAEDDASVRETVIAMLTELGYRALQASDAAGALSIIQSGIPIDLLFTDVVMPGPLKSPELARKARECRPQLSILFTSGYTENAIVHGGRLDPGIELLSKPYTRDALARKIRHLLANNAQREAMTAQAPLDKAPPATLLVCEDNELIRMSIVETLLESGYTVFEASDGRSALANLKDQKVDVLLTDVSLPDMSGVKLAARARQLRAGLSVIFATGYGHLAEAVNDPGTSVLVKPFSNEELTRAVAVSVAQVATK